MLSRRSAAVAVLAAAIAACGARAEPSAPSPTATYPPLPPGAQLVLAEPADGAVVPAGVVPIRWEVSGVRIGRTGTGPDTFHVHVVVDIDPPEFLVEGKPLGNAAGKEFHEFRVEDSPTRVELAPGKHTITVYLADLLHRPARPHLARTITVTAR